MTRTGRPTTGVKVQVRIPADVLERIDKCVAEVDDGISRAAMIRRLIVDGLALSGN